ncbi:hypothetical protein V8C86DRAFT_3148951 [Haematococcus lacustris]
MWTCGKEVTGCQRRSNEWWVQDALTEFDAQGAGKMGSEMEEEEEEEADEEAEEEEETAFDRVVAPWSDGKLFAEPVVVTKKILKSAKRNKLNKMNPTHEVFNIMLPLVTIAITLSLLHRAELQHEQLQLQLLQQQLQQSQLRRKMMM